MSAVLYKTYLTNLPSMAAVVNAFDSPEVQRAVFDVLIESFQQRLASELSNASGVSTSSTARSKNEKPPEEEDLTHELVDGESIHSFPDVSRNKSGLQGFHPRCNK